MIQQDKNIRLIDPYIEILKRENILVPKKTIIKSQEFERKKCKSCIKYEKYMSFGVCSNPNKKACKLYIKK